MHQKTLIRTLSTLRNMGYVPKWTKGPMLALFRPAPHVVTARPVVGGQLGFTIKVLGGVIPCLGIQSQALRADMWPFDKQSSLSYSSTQLEKTITPEEVIIARMIHLEARVESLEHCVLMISEAFKNLAETQNQNFLAMQKNFLQLASYVIRPSKSIMPGEQQDTN